MSDLPICAILDDYQLAAMRCADWSPLSDRVTLRCYGAPLGNEATVARDLQDCAILIAMRERTPFPESLLRRLPNLKLLITTGARNRSIDLAAAQALGITVCGTGAVGSPAAELTWAGILAFMRQIPQEAANFRAGGAWQNGLGRSVEGRRLGVIGLGKLGRKVAGFGQAFGMEVCAWTRSDLAARAAESGVTPLPLEELCATSDVITVHVAQVPDTVGLISAALIERMKPDALFVNTSRGPIADEAALIAALQKGRIGGAFLDVFGQEPLPLDHPFRSLPNVLATPHIGYVTEENYRVYYADAVDNILAWLDGAPKRVLE